MEAGVRSYLRYTRFVLVFVFVVILAGGLVRMTQSGMGCPDWPHCFGRWIPPTDASQLPPDYEKYLKKQDIDHRFNAFHTWVEYLNRLLGALLGMFLLVHCTWSMKKYFRSRRGLAFTSLLLLVVVIVEAWLGKLVVDANLAVVKVTAHMLLALVIAAICVVILHRLQHQAPVQDRLLKRLSLATLLCLLVQIVLGTEVREQVDEVSRSLNYLQRELWLDRLDVYFFLHRVFAWVAAAGCVLLFWRSLSHAPLQKLALWILVMVLAVMALGLSMAYFHIPALAQPAHLLVSAILFILVFAIRLRMQ